MPPLKAPEFQETVVREQKTGNISQPEDRIKNAKRNLPFLMDGDFLQVFNDDSRTWDFVWDKRHFVVEPGQMMWVLFEALVDVLGDPRSQDAMVTTYMDAAGNKGIVMDRYAELCRMFARYAIENENQDDLVVAAPKVRVLTNTGQGVTFPCMRPDMLSWPTPMIDPHHVNSDTTRMIDQVSAENAELRAEIEKTNARMDRLLAAKEGVDTPEE